MCLFEVQISPMSISRKKSQLAYHHGWKLLGPVHTVSTHVQNIGSNSNSQSSVR